MLRTIHGTKRKDSGKLTPYIFLIPEKICEDELTVTSTELLFIYNFLHLLNCICGERDYLKKLPMHSRSAPFVITSFESFQFYTL